MNRNEPVDDNSLEPICVWILKVDPPTCFEGLIGGVEQPLGSYPRDAEGPGMSALGPRENTLLDCNLQLPAIVLANPTGVLPKHGDCWPIFLVLILV